VNFDDVAVRIVEKDLIPAVHRPLAVIGIGHTLFLKAPLYGFDIVGTESDVAPMERVHRVVGAKPNGEILLCEMELDRAVGQERNVARIALGGDASCAQRWFWSKFEDEMLREILSDNYRITCVAAATAALATLKSRRFDIVLLDYSLPDGRGDAVAKQICASGVPLVIMSGDIGFAEAEVAGDHLTLQKPFGKDDMLVVLAQARRVSAMG
jgi:CheY-like chemotaxis protein